MTALVLCDGSEGSLRSIEVACACAVVSPPSSSSQGDSLILAHVWDPPVGRTQVSSRAPRLSLGNAGSAPLTGAATVAGSRGEAAAAVNPSSGIANAAQPSATVGQSGGSSSHAMPCADVLTTALRFMHTNKFIKDRVPYRVETSSTAAIVQLDHDGGDRGEDTAGASPPGVNSSPSTNGKSGVARRATSTAMESASPGAPRRRSVQRAGVDLNNQDSAVESGGVARNQQQVDFGTEAETSVKAAAVAKYAAARAAYHHVSAIFLGVGQHQEGKTCTVGAVAVQVLRDLCQAYPLFFIKKDGVKWRPAPAVVSAAARRPPPLRFMIVVPVPTEEMETSERQRSSATPPPQQPQQPPKGVQAAVATAVDFILTRCRSYSSADHISFAVVATSSTQGGGETTVATLSETAPSPAGEGERDGAAESAAAAGSQATGVLDQYKQFLLSLPMFHDRCSLSNEMQAQPPSQEDADDAVGVAEKRSVDDDGGDGGDANTAVAPPRRTAPVNICALKTSKKVPLVQLEATPEIALGQLVKQVSALKPEVVVMPASLVPKSLQLALLAVSNLHCVVLPC